MDIEIIELEKSVDESVLHDVIEWLNDSRGELYFELIKKYSEQAHVRAAEPLRDGQDFMVQATKRFNLLAEENVWDKVAALKDYFQGHLKTP
jgi:hypothetical protein